MRAGEHAGEDNRGDHFMAQRPGTQLTPQDKKVLKGCGLFFAGLVLIGGCSALVSGGDDSGSKSSSSSSVARPKNDIADDDKITVDDYVGQQLQAAQDAAQAAGLKHLDSTDYTGEGRNQWWDRDWTVCVQHPKAGTKMDPSDTLTFDVVNDVEGETCDDPTGSDSDDLYSDDSDDDSSSTAGVTGDSDDDTSSATSGSSSNSSTSTSGGGSTGSSSSGGSSSSSSSSGGDSSNSSGASAVCNDGSYSYSAHRQGTCSHHGGVATWLKSLP